MTKHHLLLAILSLGLSLVVTPTIQAANTKPVTTYRIDNRQVYVYGRAATIHQRRKVPLVLFMHGTGGDPQKKAIASGWAAKAQQANIIVISPSYNDLVTTENVPHIMKVVRYAQSHYSVDPQRTYSLGFSNGGATSIEIVNRHPRMFAGIAAYGWANALLRVTQSHSSSFPDHVKQPNLLKIITRWCGSMSVPPFGHYFVITR